MNYKAFHKLSYGLYIIASEYEGIKSGYIGNTVFQVTSEPPRIAISCHKDNFTTSIIQKSKIFSVSVLKQQLDTSIIGEFGFISGREFDKFSKVDFRKSESGVPVILDAAIAWFECTVVKEIDAGSHLLFLGEVGNCDILSDEPPLTYDYYREKYRMLAPKNAPTYIDKDKLGDGKKPENTESVQSENPDEKKTDPGHSFTCTICGFTYNPEDGDPTAGIPPGTPFEDLPEDYKCPICNAGKEYFI